MKNGIKAKDIRDFIKCASKLSEIVDRIREYAPEATVYATPGTLHLMADVWDDSREAQEDVLTAEVDIEMDVGDW